MVTSLFKNGKRIIYQEQNTILSGAFVISALMLLSKVLGMVKVRLYAGVLGAGSAYDVFVAADRLPDFLFQMVVIGSLNAAFIPLFTQYISQKGSKKAWQFASNVINWSVIFFIVLGLIMFVFAEPLSFLVAAGFDDSQRAEVVSLMRILLVAPVFLGISSFVAGTLQSFKRFFIPFLSPLLYNIGGIFGVVVLFPLMGVQGLGWGVVIGSVLHLIVQLPLLSHLGFKYYSRLVVDQDIKEMVQLSLPRTFGLVVDQMKVLAITNLASLLAVGSISVLRYAESIYLVPVSIIGVAIAQASLPTLSEQAAKKNHGHIKDTFLASFFQTVFLIIPIMVVLIVLKIPVVRLILGIGLFDWEATVLTAWVVAVLSMGLIAHAGNALVMRTFFALGETKLPVLISVVSGIVSVVLAAAFMTPYGVQGLAFGITMGTILEFMLLFWLLHQRLNFPWAKVIKPLRNMAISGLIMGTMIYVPVKYLDQVFIDTTRVVNLVILVWLVLTTGGVGYIVSTWVLGVEQVKMFFIILWKLRDMKEAVSSARAVQAPQDALLED